MYEPIPSDEAVELLSRVLEFRERDQRSTPTQESAELLALFPRVQVRQGYQLDFSQETTPSGVHQPILPFARPTGDDSWVPIFDGEVGREELVEQLYQYIEYEQTPAGLFEYAFFAIELWSLRASRYAAEWLESTPIFDEAAFDLALSDKVRTADVQRPAHFGPQARRAQGGGGRVRFLTHTPMGWERIYYMESLVFPDGFVDQEAGEILADMGAGLIF
jgi:hypothetical protein